MFTNAISLIIKFVMRRKKNLNNAALELQISAFPPFDCLYGGIYGILMVKLQVNPAANFD